MKATAAVLYKTNEALKVEEIDVGEPRAGEVLVRMVATGICHTELSIIHGGLSMGALPQVMGHEGAGVVEAVGSGVTRVAPGDHVILAASPHCGQCKFCYSGRPYHCPALLGMAFTGGMIDGVKRFSKNGQEISHMLALSSFASLSVVHQSVAIKVPNDVPLEKLPPLGCGVQTGSGAVLNAANVQRGDSVAVFGCGTVGLSAVMAARLARAYPIIAVDLLDHRLEVAKDLGASHVVNPSKTDAVPEIQKLTGGGADYAFECIGSVKTFNQAVDCVRINGGTTVMTGAPPMGTTVTFDCAILNMKNILGNLEGNAIPEVFIPSLLEFWRRGEFPFEKTLSKTYTLENINGAIADMEKGQVIKPIVKF